MARTDANETEGLDEAIYRAKTFFEIGADITFLEAPKSEEEMLAYCKNVPGPKMANMVEQGKTPILTPSQLQKIGYKIVAYPLTMLLSSLAAMEYALKSLLQEKSPENVSSFDHLLEAAGFPEYYESEKKYNF
jgi:2-methylisocitrate lyase-like PEP mutase family enzyme